jgi:hypothetical protein
MIVNHSYSSGVLILLLPFIRRAAPTCLYRPVPGSVLMLLIILNLQVF